MFAEFILKIGGPPSSQLYQVMFDLGWISYSGTLDPIPLTDIVFIISHCLGRVHTV